MAEARDSLAPVVLGGGNPLFKPNTELVKWRLDHVRPLKTGGVILTYSANG